MGDHTRGRYVTCHLPADLAAGGSRRQRQAQTYHAFVPDTVSDVGLSLTGDVAADLADTEAALTSLLRGPHPSGFDVLASSLLRTEAISSSWIEAIEVPHRRLAEAEHGAPGLRYDEARRVVANVQAMSHAVDIGAAARPLTQDDLCRMHELLLQGSNRRFDREHAGLLRQQPVFIGGLDARSAEFVPPPHTEVAPLLDDLLAFVNDRHDLTGVTVAAIAHAQFETIHPFHDGNGRVGRCLFHAVLASRGLLGDVLAPWSVVLAQRGDDYVTGLGLFRDDRLGEWLSFVATTLTTASRGVHGLGASVADLVEGWRRTIDETRRGQGRRAVRRDAAVLALLERLPGMPVFGVPDVATTLDTTSTTAQTAVDELLAAGIVRPVTAGRRNRVFECDEVFDLLHAFEQDPYAFVPM